jgi:hypothetical protein
VDADGLGAAAETLDALGAALVVGTEEAAAGAAAGSAGWHAPKAARATTAAPQ